MEMGTTILAAGGGFLLADALDRFLATYDPASTKPKPTDRFTSDGAGTLANTLNVSMTPNLYRAGAGLALTAVSAFGAAKIRNPYGRAALEGLAVGSGVNLIKLLWQNVVVPMLAPKDTSTAGLQKSVIARLYPAEIAAKINLDAKQTSASGVAFGALSQPAPEAGVGAPPADVGPFALGAAYPAASPYPTAEQALRQKAGVGGDSPYPDAAQALRKNAGVGGDSPYPDAAQALRHNTGVSQPPAYQPGPGSTPGPGPQENDCGCVGEVNPFLGFIGDEVEKDSLYPTS